MAATPDDAAATPMTKEQIVEKHAELENLKIDTARSTSLHFSDPPRPVGRLGTFPSRPLVYTRDDSKELSVGNRTS